MNDTEEKIKELKDFYEEQLIEACKYPIKLFDDDKKEWGDNNEN